MFSVGERIMYESNGVFRVKAVGQPEIAWAQPGRQYYTLMPLNGTGVTYVPTDSPVFLRSILTKAQVNGLIDRFPLIPLGDCGALNQKLLADRYQAAINAHDCEELVRLLKTLHARNLHCQEIGKKTSQTDQKYKKRAEDLLYAEFSAALGIPEDTVETYIQERLEQAE